MIKNYFKIAFRNLLRNKVHSFINLAGLSVGMAVVMLIGFWIHDELSFEKYHKNYDHIVQLMEHANIGDGIVTGSSLPMPVSTELQDKYKSDFKSVASTLSYEQNISYDDKAFSKVGCYAEPQFTDIITLKMLKGTQTAFKNTTTILLSESLSKAIFGDVDPINKIVKLNNSYSLQVAGIYADMPKSTQFSDVNFIAPIDLLFADGRSMDNWYSSSFQIYALLNSNGDDKQISSKIKDVLFKHSKDATKPILFLNPMSQWHLYEFKNGKTVAGRMQFVWLFGIIGLFVLLLACINFMNLSTARSEKRAKEVGIRKTIGSSRSQLIGQFFSESFLVVITAYIFSLLIVQLVLPWFNEASGKQMNILWTNSVFWLFGLSFCFFTGLIAGSYPAIYLSSFKPVKVLKGTFRAGRFAAIPRKVLVVVQFSVSVTLIIGTIIVFRQIQFAKNRPIGYDRNRLITFPFNSSEMEHYDAFRNELLQTNGVTDISKSSSPMTGIWSSADNLEWKGKDPNRQEMFGTILIDPEYEKVVNWQMKEGRNFSKQFITDSFSFIFNEAAIRQMGLKDPVGQMIKWHGKNWKVIGVVKDMVMTSPFDAVVPTVFLINDKERSFNVINLKINSSISVSEALNKIETVFKKFNPGSPFNYKFADQEYAIKFTGEKRIGNLATFFATLAIFISCLGLFGLASFVAEQRTKEIGVRKVLGASIFNLWQLLSKEFVILVFISFLIATPVAYYFMHNWLQNYQYRTELSPWIFVVAAVGALLITLLTVSFQSIKAAIANPVKSLRTE
ncbi:MAG TPA: ABC transporter permease [Chitinophagaceae bacterium]|nr:ABC transporter permease [Chitinophagaceae bacterium]